MLNRTVRGSQSRQLYTPVRLPFGSIHAATRRSAAGIRSTAVDQPATEAAPAELASAEPPVPAATAAPLVDGAAVEVDSDPFTAALEADIKVGRGPIVKVSKSSNTSAVAGYITRLLEEVSDNTVLVRAVGSAASEVALRALTRASERVQMKDSNTTLTFRPQRKRMHSELVDVSTLYANDFWVTRVPTAEVPGDIPDGLHPLVMKETTDFAAVEQYIMYAARQPGQAKKSGPLAYVIVSGPQISQKFSAALSGISKCRLNLADARKADLTVTISRSTTERPQRNDDQQQQLPAEETEPAVDDSPDWGDEANSSSNNSEAADGTSAGRTTWTRYFIQVHLCKPRNGAGRPRAAACSGRDQSSSSSSSSSRRGRQPNSRAEGSDQIATAAADAKPAGARSSRKTPGMVEVPEEEWNQLKEQLEVVPHLTEQLQVMTRQHEQLLSLLAGQQQGKQQ